MIRVLILLLWLPALWLFWQEARDLAPAGTIAAMIWPQAGDVGQMILHLSAAPRLVAALLSGAGLALCGLLLQRVLGNPLAEPATLGLFGGAQLALGLALVAAPGLAGWGAAFAGALLAFALVMALSARAGFGAGAILLSGLVTGIWLGGINAMLALFNHQVMEQLFLWQAGSLVQAGWMSAAGIAVALALAAGIAMLAARPLALLELGDGMAQGLGLRIAFWRAALLLPAVLLAATVAAGVGVIGFVGLIAPALARLGGARGRRLPLAAMAIGAGLLALADQAVRTTGLPVPAGAITALVGAGVLLSLLRRLPAAAPRLSPPRPARRARRPAVVLCMMAAMLGGLVWLSLSLGRFPDGWLWDGATYTDLRWPRIGVSVAAGAATAIAGVLMQRLTANPLASPELLGVSSGAALGLIGAVALGATGRPALVAATFAGALLAAVVAVALAARRSFSPLHLVLAGVAGVTLLSALTSLLLAGGDPRAALLMGWLAGSTWRATPEDAVFALAGAGALLATVPAFSRWLAILPMGAEASRSLGLALPVARGTLVGLTAAGSAIATLVMGPLGFLGLMAPQIARAAGLTPPAAALAGAALAGAAVMVAADWLGRIAAFPWQVPAGLMAAFLSGLWILPGLLRK